MLIANERATLGSYPCRVAVDHVGRRGSRKPHVAKEAGAGSIAPPRRCTRSMVSRKRLSLARVLLKDESVHSELGSFKALGAPIALVRLIMRLWPHEGKVINTEGATAPALYRELVGEPATAVLARQRTFLDDRASR